MIRSSWISYGAADSVVVVSSHPFETAFYPCFQRVVPCHRRGWKSCCCSRSPGQRGGRFGGLKRKRRQALRIGSGLLQREGHGGSVGPPPWPGGAASVKLVSSFFLFVTAPFNSALFSGSSRRSHCECFSRLSVLRRDVCRQGGAPLDQFPLFAPCLS